MQSKDYSKYQEIQHLVITQNDDDIIIQYMQENKWLKQYVDQYVLDLNMIYVDLIYGKYNRLLNEFLYEYIYLKKEEVVPTLKFLLSQIQTISTNTYSFIINSLSKKRQKIRDDQKERRNIIDDDYVDQQKEILSLKLQQIYNKYGKEKDNKKNSIINSFVNKLQEFNKGKIGKSSLLEGLSLRNGIYFKNDIPVIQQNQVEQKNQQDDEDDVEQIEMETQIYVFSILSEYFNFINFDDKNQEKLIYDCQVISDYYIKDFIQQQNKGAIDYYIRLTLLALYKYQYDRYDLLFDGEIYQKVLSYTEKETLKFRQSIGTEISIDVGSIVDQWWIEIENKGKLMEILEEQQEEDIFELDADEVIAKQSRTMD